jgi:hypothetical protein
MLIKVVAERVEMGYVGRFELALVLRCRWSRRRSVGVITVVVLVLVLGIAMNLAARSAVLGLGVESWS